jgi:glycosyltransferase involved in cell wall biosynthesis
LKLDTSDFNIFIGQTPYPARISKNTKMIVRYHDAIPIFMPHTIPDQFLHQASHFNALLSNVKYGAWFACVSEATRQDLLKLFPDVVNRSVVIYNMVSHHYFKENSSFDLVPQIIRTRRSNHPELSPKFLLQREQENFFNRYLPKIGDKYLLIVSTIEPRKNHARLLAAWEVLKVEIDPKIKLVVVGTFGWNMSNMLKNFYTWIERGELFILDSVPSPDLRVLYRHAAATVCPSLGEGFDFSGVESMACGGITVASDISVHREIYDDAAEYFNPYSTSDLVSALKKVLYNSDAEAVRQQLMQRGDNIVNRYTPENILPKWKEFIHKLIDN